MNPIVSGWLITLIAAAIALVAQKRGDIGIAVIHVALTIVAAWYTLTLEKGKP